MLAPLKRHSVTAAYGAILLQFGALIVLSVHIFNRFNLGIDFADFSSAWTEIGQGHLDPSSTISGFPYLQNHFELVMWPLALLHPLFHSSFVLLVTQTRLSPVPIWSCCRGYWRSWSASA
jgi:hypothetical protein